MEAQSMDAWKRVVYYLLLAVLGSDSVHGEAHGLGALLIANFSLNRFFDSNIDN